VKTNALYYGDNLAILRKYGPDESVDLVSTSTRHSEAFSLDPQPGLAGGC